MHNNNVLNKIATVTNLENQKERNVATKIF